MWSIIICATIVIIILWTITMGYESEFTKKKKKKTLSLSFINYSVIQTRVISNCIGPNFFQSP